MAPVLIQRARWDCVVQAVCILWNKLASLCSRLYRPGFSNGSRATFFVGSDTDVRRIREGWCVGLTSRDRDNVELHVKVAQRHAHVKTDEPRNPRKGASERQEPDIQEQNTG
jgi:hypothetical protein